MKESRLMKVEDKIAKNIRRNELIEKRIKRINDLVENRNASAKKLESNRKIK